MLYARTFLLRNCGRFTHVSSDFGSQYHTHLFVTSEALYASLTRGITWKHKGRFVDLEADVKKGASEDYFRCDYDVSQKPIWFTPGIFVDSNLQPLSKQRRVVDRTDFNVVDEGYPSTGGNDRAHYIPTYGRIEGILPDHRLFTWAFSPYRDELRAFSEGQIFLLGKKRTMFQIIRVGPIMNGEVVEEKCTVPYLQFALTTVQRFESFQVLATTLRYIVLQGQTRDQVKCWKFLGKELSMGELVLPEFYLAETPLPQESWRI